MPYQPPQFKVLSSPQQREGFKGQFSQKPTANFSNLQIARAKKRKLAHYMNMRFAYVLSILIHLFLPIGFVLLNLLLFILGFDLGNIFIQPEPQPKDIEFVLTPPQHHEEMPLNLDTHLRATENSRAGGENNPEKAINMQEESASSSQSIASAPALPQPVIKPAVLPPQVIKPLESSPPAPKPDNKPLVNKAKPVVPKPLPLAKAISQAPLPQIPSTPVATATNANRDNLPLPFIADSFSSSQSSASSGSIYNPSPGNKNATPGVDALKEPDFGPYMKDLQRRIKQGWRPPRGNESKKIVIVFRVNRDGQLGPLKITKSSGVPLADQAAILAVQQVFPFRPLPQEYAEEDIDIEFTFDYNVFGDKNRLRKTFGEG